MGSIGGIPFMRMEGEQMPALSEEIDIFKRPAVDGFGWRGLSLGADVTTKFTREGVTLLLTAQTASDYYKALKGWLVLLYEDYGRWVAYVLVKDVRVTNIIRCMNSSPPGINYIIEAEWDLVPTVAP
jgi:hypothetical protein